jgi:hypothetical protein
MMQASGEASVPVWDGFVSEKSCTAAILAGRGCGIAGTFGALHHYLLAFDQGCSTSPC